MILENRTWKNLLLTTVIILAGCSAPKYTYYFDTYSAQSSKGDTPYVPNSSTKANAIAEDHFLFPVQKETLVASTSNEPTVLPNTSIPNINTFDSASQTSSATKKVGLVKKLQALKKLKATVQDDRKGGDETKNKYAKRGLIFSILGLTALFLAFAIGVGVVLIAIPLAIVGIIFSSKGLKSEKHGAAITGLILGLLALNVILIGAFAYLAMGQD